MSTNYIPALAWRALTPFYDTVVRVTTREQVVKGALVAQAIIHDGDRVLDLACGTGTLTLAVKSRHPLADVTGVDGDPEILDLARDKASNAGTELNFDEALAQSLPYADGRFDVVVSSLFFHHLDRRGKLEAFSEARRVLKPGGRLHVADWGQADNPFMRAAFVVVQLLDGFATTTDNVRGLLPDLMRESGFVRVSETRRINTPLGTVALYEASVSIRK